MSILSYIQIYISKNIISSLLPSVSQMQNYNIILLIITLHEGLGCSILHVSYNGDKLKSVTSFN